MKKALHIFATLLCLLTIVIGTATCEELAPPKYSSCDHCPKQSPVDKPACCSAQQQLPSAIVSEETSLQPQLHTIAVFEFSDKVFTPLNTTAPQWTASPPHPPRTPLRI